MQPREIFIPLEIAPRHSAAQVTIRGNCRADSDTAGEFLTGFISPTKGPLIFENVVREIAGFIEEEPERAYKLVVGTDSEERENVEFVSVVVVHRVGSAARYFWSRSRSASAPSLRWRMYEEASLSLHLAELLTHGVGERLNGYLTDGTCQLEVHVDIGRFGPTRDMIKEIVGMVLGSGYTVKIKPDAYAASSVADKHVSHAPIRRSLSCKAIH